MDHTLHNHIAALEYKIQKLKDSLTAVNHDDAEYGEIVQGILTSERALQHFRQAFALEQRLREQNTEAERAKGGPTP